jgi:hypothetical protein
VEFAETLAGRAVVDVQAINLLACQRVETKSMPQPRTRVLAGLKFSRNCALHLSFVVFASLEAAAQPAPNFVGYHPMSTMTTGGGVSIHDLGLDHKRCIVGKNDDPGVNGETTADMILVTNSSQLRNALRLDLQVDASYLAFKGGAKFSYSYEGLFNDHSMVVTVTSYSEYSFLKLSADATLSPDAKALLADGPAFAKVCGTHYVSAERRGSSVSAIISISGLSSSEKTDISAEMSASGGWGPLSASAQAKFQQQLAKATQSGRARIQIVATGGNGFAGLGEVVAKLATNENSLPEILLQLDGYMKQFNASNSARIGFHLRSMQDFGWDPTAMDLFSDQKNRRLLVMTDQYRRILDMIESAKGIVAGTDARSPIVTPEQRKRLPGLIDELDGYLAKLATAHIVCTNAQPGNTMLADCQVPAEPPSLHEIIPELPAPANGRFLVKVARADGSTDTWDSVISRPAVYDRPKIADRRQFLNGAGFLEAVRIQDPAVTRTSLIFGLTGSHLISAALKQREVSGTVTIVGMIPLGPGGEIGVHSAIDDKNSIKASPDFLGKMLSDFLGDKQLTDGTEFYLDVRDRLGRTVVVPLADVTQGLLVWAR